MQPKGGTMQLQPQPVLRSDAYKTALLKDLDASTQALASAKENAVTKLAQNIDLEDARKVS